MDIEDFDLSKLIGTVQKEASKDKSKINGLASNPMVGMMVNSIPAKYKLLIVLAFLFMIFGMASAIYLLYLLAMKYETISIITLASLIVLWIISSTIKKIKKGSK